MNPNRRDALKLIASALLAPAIPAPKPVDPWQARFQAARYAWEYQRGCQRAAMAREYRRRFEIIDKQDAANLREARSVLQAARRLSP